MSLAGTLRTMNAGDLLQWLGMAQKTGTLTVTAGSLEKRIVFREGRIVSTASNDPREYLGQFLVSWGYITEEELRKAMAVQRESKILLGKILVMIGLIQEKDLLRLLRLKGEDELYNLFMLENGDFVFDDEQQPAQQMVPLQLDVMAIVMEGLRRVDEWRRIRTAIPQAGSIPVLVKEPDVNKLGEVQKGVVQAINGQRSIEELILESRSSEFVVSKTVFDLIEKGVARLDPPKPVAAPPQLPEAEPEQAVSAATPEDEVKSLTSRAQDALRQGDWDSALRTLRAAQTVDPSNSTVRSAITGAETLIIRELKKDGLGDARVPQLRRPMEELAELDFTANEGFILSRINGMWDIGSIVKISPMREIDALMIFSKLKQRDLIDLA